MKNMSYKREVMKMCKSCGCSHANKNVQYQCECPEENCTCGIIEFDAEPKTTPYCCGVPMRRVK